MKDPELIIEELPFDDVSTSQEENPEGKAEGTMADGEQNGVELADEAEGQTDEKPKRNSGKADTLRQLKEQVSEDDDVATGKITLRQIVGGDYLLALVRHYVWFIVLVVMLTCVYVGVRYQCQQDVIEISRLEKELVDAKYRAMSSSSNLTEICRQSNVLKVLGENEDNKLMMPEQPPYIIEIASGE